MGFVHVLDNNEGESGTDPFPGHVFYWEGSHGRAFRKPDEEKISIVQVFGVHYPVLDNDGYVERLAHDIVCTMRDKECRLFERLSDGAPPGNGFPGAMAWLFGNLLLALVIFVGCLVSFWWTGHSPFPSLTGMGAVAASIVFASGAAICTTILVNVTFELAKSTYRTLRLHYTIIFQVGRHRGKELLTELTKAGDEYIAGKAQKALRTSRLYV